MKIETGLLIAITAMTAQTASAAETRIERKETCVCTSGASGATPSPVGDRTCQMQTEDNIGGDPGGDVNVRVFKDETGNEKHVIVVRRLGRDNADANNDGKVTRKEFLARAEKRFAELDNNNDGSLSKEEAQPPMPPLPPIPGVPPVPPVPPMPPAPPSE